MVPVNGNKKSIEDGRSLLHSGLVRPQFGNADVFYEVRITTLPDYS